MLKFLHAADIHLDSPLRGLERYDGAPAERARQATRRAFENLVGLALDERVRFVLVAGDLYDGDWKDYNTGLFMAAQFGRLREADIPVFAIAGNHDAANRMTRALRLPDNVTLLSAERPETRVLEDVGVAVHGQGFATAAVTDNLAARYPHAKRGYFNIGLLHTCATGRDGHERYAPCELNDLRIRHYDYWALGHIHRRETLDDDPVAIFPGNLQGRHVRETGPKGCVVVTVQDGRKVEAEFRALDVLRWEVCRVDGAAAATPDAVLDRVGDRLGQLRAEADGRPLCVRVEIHGPCPAHDRLVACRERWTNEVRARAIEVGGEAVWVEKVQLRTAPPNEGTVPAPDGPFEELLALVDEYRADEGRLATLRAELAELERRLPPELLDGPDALRLGDPAWLRGVLEEVPPLLVQRLLARGAGR